jgi:nicotinamide riboside kinase
MAQKYGIMPPPAIELFPPIFRFALLRMKPRIITIVGPESSGKTTLADELARRYGCPWVPEYAREYLNRQGPAYAETDLVDIAAGQRDALRAALDGIDPVPGPQVDDTHPHIVIDGGVFSVAIWSLLKFGRVDPAIGDMLAEDPTTLYLVLRPVLPWAPDPLRESPRLLDRAWIYNQHLRLVREMGKPYRIR